MTIRIDVCVFARSIVRFPCERNFPAVLSFATYLDSALPEHNDRLQATAHSLCLNGLLPHGRTRADRDPCALRGTGARASPIGRAGWNEEARRLRHCAARDRKDVAQHITLADCVSTARAEMNSMQIVHYSIMPTHERFH